MQVSDSRLTLLYVYLILYIITIKEKTFVKIILEVKVWLFLFFNRMTVSIFMVYFNSPFNFTLIHCSVIIADSLLSDGNSVAGLDETNLWECWHVLMEAVRRGRLPDQLKNSLCSLEMYRLCNDPFYCLKERSLVRHSSLVSEIHAKYEKHI